MTGCAIVTGSASGIGRAIAERLAADGFPVLLADIRRDPLTGGGAPTDEQILAQGGRCEFVRTDVSSRAECERLVARAVDSYGRLEVLVNNAVLAGQHSKPLLDTLDADWDAMMAVNLRGPFMLCQAAVRQMLSQEARGEVCGRQGRPGPADPPDRGRARARRDHLQRRGTRQDHDRGAWQPGGRPRLRR